MDSRSTGTDLYAPRLDGNGTGLWGLDGIPPSTMPGQQSNPVAVPDGAGGAIVGWQLGSSNAADLYAQRVAGDGTLLWMDAGIPVCVAENGQSQPGFAPTAASERWSRG
jgi:hypothetical protein